MSIAISIASSFKDQATRPYNVVFGEIGLTGEVHDVSRIDQRVKGAEKLGFRRVIMPEKSLKGWTHPSGMKIIGVNTVAEALKAALG